METFDGADIADKLLSMQANDITLDNVNALLDGLTIPELETVLDSIRWVDKTEGVILERPRIARNLVSHVISCKRYSDYRRLPEFVLCYRAFTVDGSAISLVMLDEAFSALANNYQDMGDNTLNVLLSGIVNIHKLIMLKAKG